MITLKIERDDTRMLQENFFPYLSMLVNSKIKAATGSDDLLNWKIIRSLFTDIKKKVTRKLLTEAKRFTFKFSDAEGITVFQLLMVMPVTVEEIYMQLLRTRVCDTLHKQMNEPE